jgi:hypothetical protein
MNGARFEEWLENGLLRTIGKVKTVIMDRARFLCPQRQNIVCVRSDAVVAL